MLGLGWGEMLVLASIAIVVLGPKDLVVTLRGLGRSLSSVRGMARDFQRQVNDVFDDVDVDPRSWTEPEEPAELKEAQRKAMQDSVNKAVLKKEVGEKSAAEKSAKPKAKKTAAKKPATKKPAAKKPTTKKPAAKKKSKAKQEGDK